ncbi:molybdenum cofactor guanylyltransferase [Geomonas sp. RF6]|uniref:molybdenum cofactor guanylyltransferase n=1 Tax=Geomonas sp. RF6 TaxID=2897342 RepID=UPI001E3B180E|nr:molybdenum cofactor guanylyltransferase [Geomonas sp. RF6]UFS69894.1 molybdenum cofactor guanylyltransferase [Geomonas sp. RF6]
MVIPGGGGELSGITGVILAGGASSRMKRNKALLPIEGETFIGRTYRKLKVLFPELLLVTNTPELYDFIPCPKVPDFYPGAGALAGIHAGLMHAATQHVFVVACDMPFLNESLIRYLCGRGEEGDIIIPENHGGVEPLHAVYSRRCCDPMQESLSEGRYRIIDCFNTLSVVKVSCEEVERIDPHLLSFRNVNTPEEYEMILQGVQGKGKRG